MNRVLFLILLLSVLCRVSFAQPSFWGYNCSSDSNYTSRSTFAANLNILLSNIASGAPFAGGYDHYYNLTVGTKPGDDFASGSCLCRGDLSATDCRSSCTDAARAIRRVCPNQTQAIGWYRDSLFRYSNRAIWGIMASSPMICFTNPTNASEPKAFNQQHIALLRILQDEALYGPRYATGSRNVSGSQNVYADLGCSPDLNASECLRCYEDLINYIPSCCYGKTGGAILTPSCDSRFDVYQFYHLDADSLSPPSLRTTKDHARQKGKSLEIPVFIATPTFVAISLAIIGIWLYRRRRKAIETTDKEMKEIIVAESLQFDLTTIKAATRNFSLENKLGVGGFGEVYKGKLGSGQDIAVKRLSRNSGQGVAEFKNEVVLVAKLQHKNLVKLLGFCMELEEKILVYEFLPNLSLNKFLFDPIKTTFLDWKGRFKIIQGIARGILYLHEGSRLKVIHRDLKSSNVLLDESMNPKISDFGLAKLFGVDQTQGDTNRIIGTYGYMAPEYALTGQFSTRSDVFSFGVIVLEIVSAQKSSYFARRDDEEALLHRAWRLWNEEKVLELVDPGLGNKYQVEEVTKCIHIALLSIQEDPTRRPRMTMIVAALDGDSIRLPIPSGPRFFRNSIDLRHEVEASCSCSVTNDITDLHPR